MKFKLDLFTKQIGEAWDNSVDFHIIIEDGRVYVATAYTIDALDWHLTNCASYFSQTEYIIVKNLDVNMLAEAVSDIIMEQEEGYDDYISMVFGKEYKLKDMYENSSFFEINAPCFDTNQFEK